MKRIAVSLSLALALLLCLGLFAGCSATTDSADDGDAQSTADGAALAGDGAEDALTEEEESGGEADGEPGDGGDAPGDDAAEDDAAEDDAAGDDGAEEAEAQGEEGDGQPLSSDTLARVSAINTDGSYELIYYQAVSGGEISVSDYAAVDMSAYEATETAGSLILPAAAALYRVSEGALSPVSADSIAVGDMLLITTESGESGDTVVQIVVYPAGAESVA